MPQKLAEFFCSKEKAGVWNVNRKIPIISHAFLFVQKAESWAHFRGSLYSEGLIIGGSFVFHNGFGLDNKNSFKQLAGYPDSP